MPISPSVDLQKETKKVTTSIKRKLVTQMKQLLCRYGFVQTKNAVWNRYTHTLRQCFEFRQCRDKFDFRYGYNILDKYDHLYKISLNDCAYAWNIERSVNLPKSIDGVSSLVEELVNYIQQEGLPFFERYKELNQILDDYKTGILNAQYFGLWGGWQEYNMGMAFWGNKENDVAKHYFQLVIDKYSDKDIEFVSIRKTASELWIKDIEDDI